MEENVEKGEGTKKGRGKKTEERSEK